MANLSVKEKAALRSEFYEGIEEMIGDLANVDVVGTEPIATGLLIHLENGAAVEVRVIVKDENKFNLEAVRAAYRAKLENAAERAAKHAEVEARKAAKAAEKAAKEQTKDSAEG